MRAVADEERTSFFDIAWSLAQAVRDDIGGRRLLLTAREGDQMLVIVDSSGAASQFSVGIFVTTMSAAVEWYKAAFLPWNAARRFPGEDLSYKDYKVNDARLNDLRAFMAVTDLCAGQVISVASPSLSQHILTSAGDTQNHPDLIQFRDWSRADFERLMRTSCAIAIGMEQFYCHPERWNLLHDTDQLFAATRRETSLHWLRTFVSIIRDNEPTPLILTTKEEVADPLFAKALLGHPAVYTHDVVQKRKRYCRTCWIDSPVA